MIILSDCFENEDSEGCRKVAKSLAMACKQRDPNTLILALNTDAAYADVTVKSNKLLLSPLLAKLLKRRKEDILYIPGSAGTAAGILRVFLLSWMNGGRVRVLFSGLHKTGAFFSWLLKISGAEVLTLSQDTCRYYQRFLPKVSHLKTGVDTCKFTPVSQERKQALRREYGVSPEERIVLHVGHMQEGRNLRCLSQLAGTVLLVLSPATKNEENKQLRKELENCSNIVLIDRYLPNIAELYQLSDVYLFPVQKPGHCIDTPLSALEAMACGLPLVTSDFGELKAFRDVPGVCIVDDFDRKTLENAIGSILGKSSRQAVLKYDWRTAAEMLLEERV